MNESEFVFRPYTPEDRPFIESSWASSYYSALRIKDLLSPDDFHAFHRPLRDRFFSRPSATVIIVSPVEDPDFILGWCAVEVLPNCSVLHYVYVKSAYRKDREAGTSYALGTQLIERSLPLGPVVYTHLTPRAAGIMGRHNALFKGFRFVPHLT